MKPSRRPYEHDAVGFAVGHLLCGGAGGLLFGILLVVLDVGHLRSLTSESSDGVLALALFVFGVFALFGGLAVITGIAGLDRGEN